MAHMAASKNQGGPTVDDRTSLHDFIYHYARNSSSILYTGSCRTYAIHSNMDPT